MLQSAGAVTSEETRIPSRAYRSYVILLLFAVCTLNFLDRQIIVILSEPLKRAFSLKDWQLGALTGFAFAFLYSVLGIPVARFADRGRRSLVITASLIIWSLSTVACGLASGFAQLALARVFVGVGEAGGSPPAQSLITEYTPLKNRAFALAIYSSGIPVGVLLGLAIGGLIADRYGWRTAFFVAGAPGLLLSVVTALTLREPRHSLHSQRPTRPNGVIRAMFQSRSFVLILIGGSMVSFLNYGQGAFLPSLFLRHYMSDLALLATDVNHFAGTNIGPLGLLGMLLGLSLGVAGIIGNFVGGFLTDLLARYDLRAYVNIQALAAFARVPLFLCALNAPSATTALALLTAQSFFSALGGPAAYASIQGLVPSSARSTAAAIFLFGLNSIGLGLGPLFIGMLSDGFAAFGLNSDNGLRGALAASEIIMVLAAICFFLARRTFRTDTIS